LQIEIALPDLAPYAHGNAGLPYVWTFTGSKSGPHVLVQALTHGNEICGAVALDHLLRRKLRPRCGTLSLCFANVAAYELFDVAAPFASRCIDEDFNRLWSAAVLNGAGSSAELARARELRPLYDSIDHLLDLHSMSDACRPLALAGIQAKGLALARALAYPQHIVVDAGHAAGTRLRDYASFADNRSPRSALLVECGQHWQRSTAHVALQTALRFLHHFGMLDAKTARDQLDPAPTAPQLVIQVTEAVTIRTDQFRFVAPVRGLSLIRTANTLLALDGQIEVRTPYNDCVLVMPHLKPSKKPGETAVRLGRFVECG
jgi:predicted deacylase